MKKLIIQSLEKLADPVKGKLITNYMKNVVPFRGIQQLGIQSILNEYKSQIKELDEYDIFKLAEELVYSQYGEDKKLGLMICQYVNFGFDLIKHSEKWFRDGTLTGWAFSDSYSSIILKKYLQNKENAKLMKEWAKDENLWIRRCSCVGFISIIRKYPVDMEMLYEICLLNIRHHERFNQLGTGWLLREMSVKDKDGVIQFIEQNLEYFSAEGLRYSYEKMNKKDQKYLKGLYNNNKKENIKESKRLSQL